LTKYWKDDKNITGVNMNIIAIVLGVFSIGYGVFSAIIRVKSPEKFGKLEAMKKKFGDKTGNVIHVVFYTFIPISAGIVFLVCGFLGISLF
jgi:hypothetical protein